MVWTHVKRGDVFDMCVWVPQAWDQEVQHEHYFSCGDFYLAKSPFVRVVAIG